MLGTELILVSVVGKGPFVLEASIPGDHITVVANPEALTASELARIISEFVPDVNTALASLRVGEIDLSWDSTSNRSRRLRAWMAWG